MLYRFTTLTGAVGALIVGSTAIAAPPSSPCKVPEVAKRDQKGQKVGDWKALSAKIGTDGAGATEAAAIASVCKYRGCDASTTSFLDGEASATFYLKGSDGSWYAFSDIMDLIEGSAEVTTAKSADGRWLHVGLKHEILGRIEDAMCEEDEDGNVECVSATGSFGYEYANLVIDTKSMTLAFDAHFSDFDDTASDKLRCKRTPSTTSEGESFSYTDCVGATTRFKLADLAGCTTKARGTWNDAVNSERDSAERAESEAKMAAAMKKVDAGRKATAAKKYDEAIGEFDAALKINGFIAKAFSGRGYAKLLREGAGDLEGAKADFQRALEEETGDMKFRASVHYNLGLIAEKQKKPDEAKAWFKKSHGQNPTAATKKKLGL